jgi:uncharacterized protein (TIGR02145 family)
MKTIFRIFIVIAFIVADTGLCLFGQISINSDASAPDASAILDVKSTTMGMLTPRMTSVQRNAITSPANGLLIYQTDDTAGFYFYTGTGWAFIGSSEGTSGNVMDVDGNVYPTIKIGTQEWMAENLRVTHNRFGDPILNVINDLYWFSTTEGAYCWYLNNESNKMQYGALYNWYAVNGSSGTPPFTGQLCPVGWHMPTETEWNILITYLGGISVAGGKMKTDILWNSPNTGATNSSAFSGRPGGIRASNAGYTGLLEYGNWWSATELNTNDAHYCWLFSGSAAGTPINTYSKNGGFSVRCVKN